jgi:hypothetical protein
MTDIQFTSGSSKASIWQQHLILNNNCQVDNLIQKLKPLLRGSLICRT